MNHFKDNIYSSSTPEQQIYKIYTYPDDFDLTNRNILGEGGYGIAILCRLKTGQSVVLKQFKSNSSNVIDTDVVRECFILKQLNLYKHQGFCEVYGLATDKDNNIYLVMETLVDVFRDLIKKQVTLDTNEYKKILYQLFLALNHLHNQGYHHSDIKPDNIMYKNGNIKIIDFGFTEFLGISPVSWLMENYFSTYTTKAPDDENEYNNHDSTFIDKGFVKGNRKSYQSDTFSAVSTWLQLVFGKYTMIPYLVTKDNKELIYAKFRGQNESIDITFIIEKDFGKDCVDVLVNCLRGDITKRFCCKQALKHHFFNDLGYPVSINISKIKNMYGGVFTATPCQIFNKQINYNKSQLLGGQFELVHIYELYKFYGEQKLYQSDIILPMDDEVQYIKLMYRNQEIFDFYINKSNANLNIDAIFQMIHCSKYYVNSINKLTQASGNIYGIMSSINSPQQAIEVKSDMFVQVLKSDFMFTSLWTVIFVRCLELTKNIILNQELIALTVKALIILLCGCHQSKLIGMKELPSNLDLVNFAINKVVQFNSDKFHNIVIPDNNITDYNLLNIMFTAHTHIIVSNAEFSYFKQFLKGINI